jgi:hypothetical protein
MNGVIGIYKTYIFSAGDGEAIVSSNTYSRIWLMLYFIVDQCGSWIVCVQYRPTTISGPVVYAYQLNRLAEILDRCDNAVQTLPQIRSNVIDWNYYREEHNLYRILHILNAWRKELRIRPIPTPSRLRKRNKLLI